MIPSTSATDLAPSTTIASTTTAAAATTVPAATIAETTLAPTTVVPTTVPETTVATTVPPQTTVVVETTVATTPVTESPTTVAPPTIPPATVPPATVPPTVAPLGCVACKQDYRFPYAYFQVPQLGTEPVRGTGCGADGSLGTSIPDGIWDGFITIGSSSLQMDVQCIYYGASAQPFIDQCEEQHSADDCLENGNDFWMVNNNPRKRTVTLDPTFRRRYANTDCADPGPGKGTSKQSSEQDAFDSWVVIENGRATFALTSCVYG